MVQNKKITLAEHVDTIFFHNYQLVHLDVFMQHLYDVLFWPKRYCV